MSDRSFSHLKERKRKKNLHSLSKDSPSQAPVHFSPNLQIMRVASSAKVCPPALSTLALAHITANLLAGRWEGTFLHFLTLVMTKTSTPLIPMTFLFPDFLLFLSLFFFLPSFFVHIFWVLMSWSVKWNQLIHHTISLKGFLWKTIQSVCVNAYYKR